MKSQNFTKLTLLFAISFAMYSCNFSDERLEQPNQFGQAELELNKYGYEIIKGFEIKIQNGIEVPIKENGMITRITPESNEYEGRQRAVFLKNKNGDYDLSIIVTYIPSNNYSEELSEINLNNFKERKFDGKIFFKNPNPEITDFEILYLKNGEEIDKGLGARISKDEFDKQVEKNENLRIEGYTTYTVYYSQTTDWFQWNGSEYDYLDSTTEHWTETITIDTTSNQTNTSYAYINRAIYGGGTPNYDPHLPPLPPNAVFVYGREGINIYEYLDCFSTSSGAKISIHVDQPTPHSSKPYAIGGSGIVDVGHTYIGIEQNGIKRYFGFYPSDDVKPKNNYITSSVIDSNSNSVYDVSLSKNVSSAELIKIINYAKNYSPTYNLNAYNCTDFGIGAMKEIGLTLPASNGSWPGGSGSNPGTLGQYIRNTDFPGYTKNVITRRSTNSGSCN